VNAMAGPRSVKVGLIQMAMLEDRIGNLEKAGTMVSVAKSKGADIVCLPELFNSPYFPQEERSRSIPETIPGHTTRFLSNAAKTNEVVLVGGSIYEKDGQKSYNTSVVFDTDGKILGKYRKVHVPSDPSFYEQSYFESGSNYRVFDTKFGRIGVLICFDQWYPEPARILKLMGADIIFYPTAIGLVKGIEQSEGSWQSAWESVQRGHAISNSIVLAAVNRVGTEKDMTFWGGSIVFDQFGKTLFRAEKDEGVFVTSCDFSLARDIENGWRFLGNRKPATYSRLLK
jgi:predicted amidohydrolase